MPKSNLLVKSQVIVGIWIWISISFFPNVTCLRDRSLWKNDRAPYKVSLEVTFDHIQFRKDHRFSELKVNLNLLFAQFIWIGTNVELVPTQEWNSNARKPNPFRIHINSSELSVAVQYLGVELNFKVKSSKMVELIWLFELTF